MNLNYRHLIVLLGVLPLAAQGQRAPQEPRGAVPSGTYRNLFVEAGYPAAEVRAKVDAAFQQLFYGDPDTQTLYYTAGKNENGELAYVMDINNNDVRSEGMSYAMMIAVQLDKKKEFDALWNWAKTYMYRDEAAHPCRGYFSWSMKRDGTPNDETPAPDGEEYFVMALYFAAGRWGNGTGIYNYRAEADQLLIDMLHHPVVTGTVRRRHGEPMKHTSGNMFHPEHKMVRFVPGVERWDFTDPSYHLPAFYELWARWGPENDRRFWAEAADASREFFQRSAHPQTSLTPEYAYFDGGGYRGPGMSRENFIVDAWRTAMNWSVDWAWWEKDERERQLSDRLQAFFESKGMNDYPSSYRLNGTPLGRGRHSAGLVAMNAVASLAATNEERAKKFVQALWEQPVPSGRGRYYDGMLHMLALLHCSGEFRAWTPK